MSRYASQESVATTLTEGEALQDVIAAGMPVLLAQISEIKRDQSWLTFDDQPEPNRGIYVLLEGHVAKAWSSTKFPLNGKPTLWSWDERYRWALAGGGTMAGLIRETPLGWCYAEVTA